NDTIPDKDGDGTIDKDDEPYDPFGDDDGDGIPNASDNDDDGDNIPDWYDPHVDTDNDGEPNWKDPDDDGNGSSPDDTDDDDDGDGILDVNDPDHPDFWEPQDDRPEGAQDDSNGDGTPKDTDSDDRPDVAEEDDDNDGTPDQDERDRDGDGKVDRKDDDDDGDGTDDLTDTDDDNDGIPDIYDPDADSDGDGVPDWMDEDPLDPNVPESGKDDGDGQGSGSGSGGGGSSSVVPSTPSGEEDKGKKCPCDIFGDIEHDSWYHDAVDYVYNGGLMEGMPGSLFAPCSDSTRAQVVMILWRLEGKPAVNHPLYFADVNSSLWYIDALRWANSEEVAIGYDDGRFGGNDAITREQLATVMWRFAKLRGFDVSGGKDVSLLTFSDAKKVSAYAVAALQWACSEGIIDGTVDEHGNVLLDPQGHATRAQLATILMRFCEGVL
ncbi:MAG: S-layer homology domain-containing protein, partial [Oscillospiraceae bacterium]|nr:S-layer homology domain-containing protein [Oscillospiraceae bacterium]